MKRHQLKAIIKEIVTQVMAEMPQQPQKPEAYIDVQDWEMIEDDLVEFKGVLLPDEREVDITVEFSGDYDDGAFDYEYGSIRGTHRYAPSFETDKVQVTYATDTKTGQQLPLDPAIVAAGNALFDSYEDSIIEYKNDHMPSNEPDPDDLRDRDIDREMGL